MTALIFCPECYKTVIPDDAERSCMWPQCPFPLPEEKETMNYKDLSVYGKEINTLKTDDGSGNDWLERLKDQLRKGYELGGGELCLVTSRDLELLIVGIEQLDAELKKLMTKIEQLRVLKTPATRKLLNITKEALDNAEAEIEQLLAENIILKRENK
jgi:hypothetical protein